MSFSSNKTLPSHLGLSSSGDVLLIIFRPLSRHEGDAEKSITSFWKVVQVSSLSARNKLSKTLMVSRDLV